MFDAGQIDGRPFITMAYIAGTPLEEEIDPEAPMPQLRAAEIVRKIALALEHAHGKGIVHRDLKPANVMMAAGGEPVVMDFGLAKRVADVDPNEAKLTRHGGLLGTPSYMSPEQVKGESSAVGPATDVYALGVMLFEMLTGKTPYTGGDGGGDRPDPDRPGRRRSRSSAPTWMPGWTPICRKAMAKKPADRFPSMAEFADALGQVFESPGRTPSAASGSSGGCGLASPRAGGRSLPVRRFACRASTQTRLEEAEKGATGSPRPTALRNGRSWPAGRRVCCCWAWWSCGPAACSR